jgi:uncharacterized protein (DUF488 family)
MLQRQRSILAMLHAAGGSLNRTTLVKCAFLLRQETALKEDPTFYDFLPYKYGPFSFGLYREIDALRRDGYLDEAEEHIALSPGFCSALTIAPLPQSVKAAVRGVATKYGRMKQRDLLMYVYHRYPWYAIRTEIPDIAPPSLPHVPDAEPAVYTIGYEGRSVDSFFNYLLSRGIKAIVDVRANAISRKYGFAGKSLADISSKLGLDYRHMPQLGICSEERQDLAAPGAHEALLDRYERVSLPQKQEHMGVLSSLLLAKSSVILCMERDPGMCHRGRLAPRLSHLSGLPIVHL